jgi:hypothetical protein
MVVLIGPRWETLKDEGASKPRLQGRHDPVRREVAAALERRVSVFAVLASRFDIPQRHPLPDDLRQLFDS